MIRKFLYYIPKFYHYVPPCPVCGSTHTGYFIYSEIEGKNISRALRRGELVRTKCRSFERNAFCEDCDIDFVATVSLKIMKYEDWLQELENRGLNEEDYKAYNKYLTTDKDQYKQNIKDARKEKILNAVRNIGKQFSPW